MILKARALPASVWAGSEVNVSCNRLITCPAATSSQRKGSLSSRNNYTLTHQLGTKPLLAKNQVVARNCNRNLHKGQQHDVTQWEWHTPYEKQSHIPSRQAPIGGKNDDDDDGLVIVA